MSLSVIGGSWHKYNFCDKTHLLSWQKYACHDKVMRQTYFCHDKFYHHKYLLRQTEFCCDKSFVVTSLLLLWQTCFRCDENMLVTTKLLWWQTCVKVLSQQKYCVATDIIWSWQKTCFVSRQTCVCCDKWVYHDKTFLSRQKWYLWQLPPMIVIIIIVRSV